MDCAGCFGYHRPIHERHCIPEGLRRLRLLRRSRPLRALIHAGGTRGENSQWSPARSPRWHPSPIWARRSLDLYIRIRGTDRPLDNASRILLRRQPRAPTWHNHRQSPLHWFPAACCLGSSKFQRRVSGAIDLMTRDCEQHWCPPQGLKNFQVPLQSSRGSPRSAAYHSETKMKATFKEK